MRQALSSALLAAVAMAADLPTQHNDVYRTGANLQEHELTPAVVRSGRFGKLFSISVNGQVYAQPLVATGIEIDGQGPRDVVFVATMENNVYAFDANSASEAPFWKVNVGPPVPYQEIPQGITTIGDTYNIRQWIGITSTPVVDRAADRLFLTAKIKEPAGIRYRLFSLNTANGNIVRSTEITVNQNGRPIPDFAFRHLQRPGLLLSKGLIYVAFGAHQDPPDQTGWILAFSAETLEQKYALGTTERGNGGGIWQAGNGPAADDDGNLYFMTGNGDFNQRDQLGTSFVKVSPDLRILSWFTPANYRKLNLLDLDLGSAGPVLLPDTGELVGGGKEGRLFLLKQSDLGGLERHTFWHAQNNPPVQSFRGTPGWRLTWTSWIPGLWNEGYHHLHGSPVYWRSRSGRHLYIWGEEDNLRSFSYDRATHFNPKAGKSRVRAPEGMPGGILSLSADGDHDGVLWAALPLDEDAFIATVRGVLRAFDATTLEEIWSTAAADPNDRFSFAKFCPPSVVNGKVYLATFSDRLNVYGLREEAAAGPANRPRQPRPQKRRRRSEKH